MVCLFTPRCTSFTILPKQQIQNPIILDLGKKIFIAKGVAGASAVDSESCVAER
jgi:hypothetical protein